jgi:hypothetical protein
MWPALLTTVGLALGDWVADGEAALEGTTTTLVRVDGPTGVAEVAGAVRVRLTPGPAELGATWLGAAVTGAEALGTA